jgi:hypothetical protein
MKEKTEGAESLCDYMHISRIRVELKCKGIMWMQSLEQTVTPKLCALYVYLSVCVCASAYTH